MAHSAGGIGWTFAALRKAWQIMPSPRPPGPAAAPFLGEQRAGLRAAIERAFEDRRLFVLLPFVIIAGLIASLLGSEQPSNVLLASGAGVLAAASLVALRSTVALRIVVLSMAFWLGYALFAIHGALYGTEMLARPAYGTYEAVIDRVLSADAERQRVVVSRIAPAEGARQLPIRRARLFIANAPDLARGDTIRGPIRFYPVPGAVLPGAFDSQFHAYFDGIGAYGSTTQPPAVVAVGDPGALGRRIDAVRATIRARIDGVLEMPEAGIARALITGDQSGVTDEARNTMATAGLAHVLSISGMHLTMVAGSVFLVLRMALALSESVSRRIPVKRVAALGGIAAALFYFAISGGSVAATRATIMIVLVLGAVVFGRRALTMRNVAIAGLFVLVSDPASVFRPSFQLSFAAVVALIGAWELARGREWRERGPIAKFFGYFGGIVVTSLVAGAATLLFSIYHFQQTAPLSVVGNLASLPLVGFVLMPSAVVATLVMPLGLEAPFLTTMGWSIGVMLELAGHVTRASHGIDASPLLTPLSLVLGLVALAWFAFLTSWHRLAGPILLVPAVVLFALDRWPDVLIADTTQAVALRLDGGLSVVAGRPQSFAVDVWRETYREAFEPAQIACDSIACVASAAPGFEVAIVRDPAGFYEECGVDLMIARQQAPGACRDGTVIDTESLAEGGVHWLRWDAGAGRFEVRRAIPDRNRPWRAPL